MRTGAIKNIELVIVIALVSLACYIAIGYYVPRSSFAALMLAVSLLFLSYLFCNKKSFGADHFKTLLLLSFVYRMIFLFALPQLSDDYFRFMWDGTSSLHGINPYLYTPASITQLNGGALPTVIQGLKTNMNSLSYFSVYPPVLQFVFYLCAKISGEAILSFVIALRVFTILAELGTVYMILKVLAHLKQPSYKALLYALNPLVIIEFAGNLHGESIMIFFIALSFYWLVKERPVLSAIFLGLAVSTKLLPLIFLPAIFYFVGSKKGWRYILITALTTAITFLPFFNSSLITHFASSVGLYFDKFEFNASIYYLLLWVGYDVTGVNLIIVLGKILPVLAIFFILRLSLRRGSSANLQQFFNLLLFTLLAYYMFSLVVHPWYITVLVFISVFSRYRFAIIWSGLILFTYSAYLQKPYREILWITAVEYLILAIIIFAELRLDKRFRDNRISAG